VYTEQGVTSVIVNVLFRGESLNLFSRNWRHCSAVWCKAFRDHEDSNRLGVIHECDRQINGQRDGRTDIIVANAALNYAAQLK